MEWLESAEIKTVKIDESYGLKQSNIAFILMLIVVSLVLGISAQYITLIYGDSIIQFIRKTLSIGNFLNITFLISTMLCFVVYFWTLGYSIKAIVYGRTGIKNKVNTKNSLKKGIVYLIISNISILIFVGLLITNYFI